MAENTHRAILFEEFTRDEEHPSLFKVFSSYEDSADERVYADIKEKLAVHSFQEFLEKFAPTVYEKYEPSADGIGIRVSYSTKNSDGAIPLDIVNHSYYKMLLNLYRSKETSDAAVLQFNYEELFEQLKPKQEVEEVKNLRLQLNAAQEKYYECAEKGESTDEASRLFNKYMRQARQKYENSVINLLPLAMEDLNKKIDKAEELLALNAGKDDAAPVQLTAGYIAFFKEDGSLDVAPAEPVTEIPTASIGDRKLLGGVERKQLAEVISSDYDRRVETPNAFVRDLVISSYAPLSVDTVEMPLAQLEELQEFNRAKKAAYETTYQSAKASFINAMTETVQKLLSVQAFFDHATTKGSLQDGLIVANNSVGFLMREQKEKFTRFINRVGHDTVENRVWFSLVPGVTDTLEDEEQDDKDEDLLGGNSGSTSAGKVQTTKTVSMNELRQFLKIMDDAHIMTIFSFKPGENNGFLMNAEYVTDKRKVLGNLNNKHAVYAYPNFTLTRPRQIDLFESGNTERLSIPGVYIDAAYVAGGLLVGSQQQSYLIEHKLPVHRQLPCVRIDFEKTEVRKSLVTKFNRESSFGINEALRNAINEDRMGFVFSGDKMGDMKNTYVYIANTLYKSPGSDVFRPLYTTLVENYVRAVYNTVADKSISGVKREFIKGKVAGWKSCAESKEHRSDVNLLLYENESIALEENPETGKQELKIKLSAMEAVLDNIEIKVEQ